MSTAVETPVAAGTYVADPTASSVGFAVKHMLVTTFRGQFDRFDAVVVSDDDGVRFTGTVDVESVVVKSPDLRQHLMAPDFFDAEAHPQIRFASSAVRRKGERLEVDGELRIRGVSQPVTVTGTIADPTEDAFGTVRLGLELETVVDRAAFGLDWNMPLPRGGFALDNDVRLTASLSLAREA